MLKRHLATYYNLTPDAYRQRWGLPDDYPMAAPAYAAMRSKMAKAFGLGRKPAPRLAGARAGSGSRAGTCSRGGSGAAGAAGVHAQAGQGGRMSDGTAGRVTDGLGNCRVLS